jgi:hypothetical protein
MASIETRLTQLECAQEKPDHRSYTNAEIAVRAMLVLKKGGPNADRIRELFAAAALNKHSHAES